MTALSSLYQTLFLLTEEQSKLIANNDYESLDRNLHKSRLIMEKIQTTSGTPPNDNLLISQMNKLNYKNIIKLKEKCDEVKSELLTTSKNRFKASKCRITQNISPGLLDTKR